MTTVMVQNPPSQPHRMTCRVFVNFVSDPESDPMKAVVGLACAAQAVSDGHDVDVFFAAASTRMLVPGYLEGLAERMGAPPTMAQGFVQTLIDGARWHCSFNSLMATRTSKKAKRHHRARRGHRVERPAWRHCLGHCGGHRPLLLTCAEGS